MAAETVSSQRPLRALPGVTVPFIEKREARRNKVYLDSNGVPTIGVGHTGPEVKIGMKDWSNEQIDATLSSDLGRFQRHLANCVHADVIARLTDAQYAALISFAFNTGAGPRSTIWAKLNAGDLDAVPTELRKWVFDDGKKNDGLVNRREFEIKLWNGKPVS